MFASGGNGLLCYMCKLHLGSYYCHIIAQLWASSSINRVSAGMTHYSYVLRYCCFGHVGRADSMLHNRVKSFPRPALQIRSNIASRSFIHSYVGKSCIASAVNRYAPPGLATLNKPPTHQAPCQASVRFCLWKLTSLSPTQCSDYSYLPLACTHT